MTEQQPPTGLDPVAFTIDQIRITLDRIRTAWAWLTLLVEPGRERTGSVAVDDAQAERLEAMGRSDRAYREHNLRHGLSALPPSPTPVRLAVIDARVAVHDLVTRAVDLLAMTGGDATRTRAEAATGTVPAALRWIDGAPIAELGATGTGGVWWQVGGLDRVRDAQLAADVDQLLQRAARIAESSAGITGEPTRPLEHRCPACGRRSLQLEHGSRDRNRWLVRCVSERCTCAGPGSPEQPACGCRDPQRLPGRRHVWPYAELDGPYGLLSALSTAAAEKPGLRRGASGHGGWQSRGMAGQQ